ncbi:hypothetical protein SERLA73DRAFT_145018 [Serpula lacrymans var. lacrymans S7.3]|uniref:BZIP domain-containing protein n=1 Tax=Serpula lacrymans var. lacrymans (strain S7.3) TaxID=936435 RepID=F8QCU9_SERL3|nr:hypothetical protein SERLA73DRAFT_145018 [Serpula lacrymans var. lacrymans S7.3]
MATPQMSDAETIQTLMEVLKATPELQMSNDFGSEYLTSPLIDSPLDDEMLTTPAMGSADIGADILTSPFLGDFHSFGNDYFFDDGNYDSLFAEPKPRNEFSAPPVLPPNLDEMYSISPATPFLDNSSAESSPQYSNVAMPSTSKRRTTAPTGTRRNITPAALVPIDAPTQPRKYVTPSVTSRKEVPAIFARKRARSQAFGDEEDQLNEDVVINSSMTEQEQIEAKRRQNTIAARRSRKRKLEYQRELEDNVEQYKRESEVWKSRALTCQALLRSHNIECPPFPDI